MKHLKTITLIAAALVVAGCEAITGVLSRDCTDIAIPGISLSVIDSITGASLEHGATGRARDGAFVDSLVVTSDTTNSPSFPIPLALERAGVYAVSVSRAGYRDWSASNVRVTKDACHVRTATLVARLVHAG